MGKSRRNRNRKPAPAEDGSEPPFHPPAKHKNYETLTEEMKRNALFEKFYKQQKIVPEGEWDEFMAALHRDLPQSWRFVGGTTWVTTQSGNGRVAARRPCCTS